MKVKINNQIHELEDAQTIEKTLEQLNKLEATGIAVAINDVVIPRMQWKAHLIQDQDEMLIVTATQGG